MTGGIPPGSNRTSTANCDSPGEWLATSELQDWAGGGGAYKAIGDEFLGYLVDVCGLQPGDAVLDVGCGSARTAMPLTGYPNREGRSAGFDVSRQATACTVIDVQNGAYTPKGNTIRPTSVFPYSDGSFDTAFLASVFRDMLPKDVRHYLYETARVLKPGGRSLTSLSLLNEESSALMKRERDLLTSSMRCQVIG